TAWMHVGTKLKLRPAHASPTRWRHRLSPRGGATPGGRMPVRTWRGPGQCQPWLRSQRMGSGSADGGAHNDGLDALGTKLQLRPAHAACRPRTRDGLTAPEAPYKMWPNQEDCQMADYPRGDLLVEGAWLQEHLNDPNLRIVDCDTRDAYRRAHIPGAVFPSDTFLKNPDARRFVMTPEQFAAEMKSLGIDDDTLGIAYDQASNTAGRLWWALNYSGHTNVKVLNGSWLQWVAEGRPISLKMESYTTDKPFTPKVDESLLATADYILEKLNDPNVVIWDVRSDGEWNGTV